MNAAEAQDLLQEEGWGPQGPPMTPQEERETLGMLHARALRLLDALEQSAQAPSPENLRKLRGYVRQAQSTKAFSFMVLRSSGARVDATLGQGNPLARSLRDTFKLARTLEKAAPLPGRLGEERTPAGFFERLEERPGELRDLLLARREGSPSPEDDLFAVLGDLRSNLDYWSEAPYVKSSAARENLFEKLYGFCDEILTRLTLAPLHRVRANFFTLLRWRLERCEDPLAMPPCWHMGEGYVFLERSSEGLFPLLVLLRESLFRCDRSLVSAITWDVLMTALATFTEDAQGQNFLKNFDHDVDHLEAQEPLCESLRALAQELTQLEREWRELPSAMRVALAQRNLLQLAPPPAF